MITFWIAIIGITNVVIKITVIAEAVGQSRLEKNSFHITLPTVRTLLPPNKSGIMTSPIAGIKTSIEPAIIPDFDNGKITLKNEVSGLQPKSNDASIIDLSILSIDINKGKTIKGK